MTRTLPRWQAAQRAAAALLGDTGFAAMRGHLDDLNAKLAAAIDAGPAGPPGASHER